MSKQQQPAHDLSTLGFHGSYRPQDVTFLLQIDDLEPTPLAEKEYLIQSGEKHYSQMISVEQPPSDEQMRHFHYAFEQGADRLASDVQKIANSLRKRFKEQPIILVSLVRAGVPLGVLLKHTIAKHQPCVHYGISIIRDRGIDKAALEAIIQTHGASGIVFVDGWTGKGAISRELNHNILPDQRFSLSTSDMAPLVTLADVGGCAWLAASGDDWLIPSGVLGSVISGLISRSILQQDIPVDVAINDCFNPENWHGCIEYTHLAQYDLSLKFVAHIDAIRQQLVTAKQAEWPEKKRQMQHQQVMAVINEIQSKQNITNDNRIKTGIAEATRAVLRRVPELIMLREADNPDTLLLRHLAQQTGTPTCIAGDAIAPYHAITIIKKIGK